MPKLSDDTILGRAIDPAILDRESFSEAYGGNGLESDDALALVSGIRALKGKRLASLTEAESEVARLALVFAEQWERSLSDAQALVKDRQAAAHRAAQFREVRMRRWGRTELEAVIARSESVEISVLLGKRAAPASE